MSLLTFLSIPADLAFVLLVVVYSWDADHPRLREK